MDGAILAKSSCRHAAGRTGDLLRASKSDDASARAQRYLSSFAYTIHSSSPAYGQMWTADDFITTDADTGKERPWQNLILVTGNDTVFAQLSADVLRRTGQNLPMLWGWGGWRTDVPGQPPAVSLNRFGERYAELRAQFSHLPPTPWGVYMGDEPALATHPERQQMLANGLQLVKQAYPHATTYLNMLYGSIGCPGPNPGGPFLCNASTWKGDPTALAV